PLPYQDPDRLVHVSVDNPRVGTAGGAFTALRYEEMRKTARSFAGFGVFSRFTEDMALSGRGDPEMLKGARVSANFLDILGVRPVLGRAFIPEEDTPGGPSVAMISFRLWKRRFAADPKLAGKTALLNAVPYTIVGVLPAGFEFPVPELDVWVPRPAERIRAAAARGRSRTGSRRSRRLEPTVCHGQPRAPRFRPRRGAPPGPAEGTTRGRRAPHSLDALRRSGLRPVD